MPEFYLRSKFLSVGCYRGRSLLRPAEKARPRILWVRRPGGEKPTCRAAPRSNARRACEAASVSIITAHTNLTDTKECFMSLTVNADDRTTAPSEIELDVELNVEELEETIAPTPSIPIPPPLRNH